MRVRSGRWPTLAGLLLTIVMLGGSTAVLAAEPSADDPVATVDGLLDTLVAKDFAGIGAHICAERRETWATMFDLRQAFAGLPETVDVEAFMESLTITVPGRAATLVAATADTATVAMTGTLTIATDDAATRTFVGQLLEWQGQEPTDEAIDEVMPIFLSQIEQGQDLTDELSLVREDGLWLVCDELGAVASPPPSPAISSSPRASLPPMDAEAYAELLAAIPQPLRDSCEPDSYWQVPDLGPEPGEIAAADCDPDGSRGDYASFALFDSTDSMNAFYDIQLTGTRNMGGLGGPDDPGCFDGPGEGTWEHGRRFCYLFINDANVRWTHDDLRIAANAIRDDGDWAALGAFFASAGPLAP